MNRVTVEPPAPFAPDEDSLKLLSTALQRLGTGFAGLPEKPSSENSTAIERVLFEVADRLRDNFPYFHPLYAGQMLKPPHPVARLAYALAMSINPNNHALDGGRASSAMEREAVAEIARMFGWETHIGHLCGGGTMANLEALWVASCVHPGKKILASSQSHYTHERMCQVLRLEFQSIPCDSRGRMNVDALEEKLKQGDIGTVVATIGTTATGSVDPLPGLLDLKKRYAFRLHADAAYGGYFGLTDNLLPETRLAYDRLSEVDSIVIDPHKHGLQPYGCGCVLFRDPTVGQFYKHHSPFTYFSSAETHLGEISLECSRPGAAAVALWATQRLLPLQKGGEFARMLTNSRKAALELYKRIKADRRFIAGPEPALDIVVWVPRARTVSEASLLSRQIYDEAAKRQLHLALATLPTAYFKFEEGIQLDANTVVCLRSVLMKPEHLEWTGRIFEILADAYEAAILKSE